MAKLRGIVAVDVRSDDATPQHDLGALARSVRGDIYRYCKVGATAIVPGKLYDGPAIVANHVNIAVAAAVAVGALSVTVTLGATAATVNQYSGGKITISDEAGEGYSYEIKSHPAADASASLVLTLEDSEPIVVALTTSSEATLISHQYRGVIIHASTETGIAVGNGVTAVTALQYGWLQTGGVGSSLSDATVSTQGSAVSASATTDGATTIGNGILDRVGIALTPGVSTEYRPVYFTIDT